MGDSFESRREIHNHGQQSFTLSSLTLFSDLMVLIQNISYMAELSIMTFAVVGFGFFNLTKSEATRITQL